MTDSTKSAQVGLAAALRRAIALHQQGRLEEAGRLYREVLEVEPDNFDAFHLLGVVAYQTGDLDRAAELIGKAVGRRQDNPHALSNFGNVLKDLSRSAEAVVQYDRALALKPDFAEVYYNRGNALLDLKRPDAAIESYDRAIALKPAYAEAYNNRGNALRAAGLLEASLGAYADAIRYRPNHADTYNNMGVVLVQLGRYRQAITNLDRAIALNPASAAAHMNRGDAYQELAEYPEAIKSYDQALAIDPTYAQAQESRLYSAMRSCAWDDFDAKVAAVEAIIAESEVGISPFPAVAFSRSTAIQARAGRNWMRGRPVPQTPPIFPLPAQKIGPLRIGYFSADYHEHATAYLMAGLFEQHDRSKVEIIAFSYGRLDDSPMRQRLTAGFDRFIDVAAKSDAEIAQLSRELGIDIAVDLKGATAENRINIFAYRAAPVQATYLGFPGPLGAPGIDYVIADSVVIPPDELPLYAEKAVYLPHCYLAADSRRPIADRAPSREAAGLPAEGFVFCCFNNNYKIGPKTFDSWMRILARVDGAVLWLLADNDLAAANLRREAAQRGIDPQRLIFAKRLPSPEHLARHQLADLFIDCLPCNAHTTASDALWAGLPLLTLKGTTFAGRVAASQVLALGLPELVTASEAESEAKAIALGHDPSALAAIKQKLAANRLTEPLFDTKRLARNIENAFAKMYERYAQGLPPDHLVVGDLATNEVP